MSSVVEVLKIFDIHLSDSFCILKSYFKCNLKVQKSNLLFEDMQNSERKKTKVENKLLSLGLEPRNHVSEGGKRHRKSRSPPTQRKSKLVYSCRVAHDFHQVQMKKLTVIIRLCVMIMMHRGYFLHLYGI